MRKLNEPDLQYGQMKCDAHLGSGKYIAVDSPIEKIFAELFARSLLVDHGTLLEAQYKLENYRYDFAITFRVHTRKPKYPDVFIECDGNEYHSSVWQRFNDILKNELAAQYGIRLLRFTGTDLHRRPSICIDSLIVAAGEFGL